MAWQGCATPGKQQAEPEKVVNIYTHRHYDTDQQLFDLFEKQTGIKVNVVKAADDELINRMESEGPNCPADLLITVDAGRLYRAQERGLLQGKTSSTLDTQVPANLRDPQGHWYGLTRRARVIAYSKDRVKPADLSTYEALADAKWKGKVLVRSSDNLYNQSLMASILSYDGAEATLGWAKGIVANMAREPKGNDRDQVKAIAAGEGDVALVNTYYIGLLTTSKDEAERQAAAAIRIFFPNQEGRGTHVNISGAGVARFAPHPEYALQLLEFLTGKEAQSAFASANFEYPVNPAVEADSLLKSWGTFRSDTLNLSTLGKLNKDAVQIFDKAGWK